MQLKRPRGVIFKMKPHRTLSRIAAFCPAAVWYFVICCFSSQTATASGTLSEQLLYRFLDCSSVVFRGQSEDGKQAIVLFLSFLSGKRPICSYFLS